MAKQPGLLERSFDALRQDGLAVLPRKVLLYLSRRAAWRSEKWSKRLDFAIARDRLLREYGPLLQRNEIFRDCHRGQRCFVIGNGPSLKKQDLSLLANELTFAVNTFYLHPLVGESWQPSYYFLSDPQYFNGTAFLPELSSIASHIHSPLFVPCWSRDFLDQTAVLPADRTYYVATCGGMEDSWREKPDFTRVTPGTQTVVQLAIMAAMYMGFKEIYLLGVDHDWLSHGGEDLHFYTEHDAEDQPDGHVGPWTYRSLMAAMTIMWQGYEMLFRVAQSEGIRIFNATHGGFLDVFERRSYESIVAKKKLKEGAIR